MAEKRGPDATAAFDAASFAPAEIDRLVRERLDQDRERADERRWEGVPETTRHWLALAPPFTASVARAAGVSRDLLDTLADRGALRIEHPRYLEGHGDDAALYDVTESASRLVLARATADSSYAARVRSSIAKLGQRVVKRASDTPGLPAPLERWCALAARADDTPALVRRFDVMIDDAARLEDAAGVLGWIESARPLATLLSRTLDPALEVALHRAGRRLELLHRYQQDRRHLKSFLRRDEQIEALRGLVDGPDDAWGLHLFGSGGVGKTMLLRYLEAELAPRKLRSHELPTARIDFDYLNADYPRLAPGLLLWSFGQELRRFADPDAIGLFDYGDGYLRELHQRIRAEAPIMDSAATTRDPAFIQAVELYIDAMRSLPQPVILVLDTCEELAKVRPDGTVPENVRETFRILEALHNGPRALLDERAERATRDGLPGLRVVFAGRRPLANEGAGWRAERTIQPPRRYLALHELRGFTAVEARTFLAGTLKVPEELVEPIADATRETAPASPIVWADPQRAPADVARCNPYDLRLYADWANETPRPAPELIRHATAAQYVELRILQRLGLEPLERILPGLALVKHVDAGIVAAAGGFDASMTQFVFEQLAEQEWIELRRASFRDGTEVRDVLTVDEGLRRALASYYDERGGAPQDMARRLADHLESRTLNDDLGDLDWSTFDAALRALESDGARLARWWTAVETRILEDRGVGWLRDVTGALIAEGAAAGAAEAGSRARRPRVSRIRAGVLASYATSLLRSDAGDQVGGVWPEVLEEAHRVPDDALARRLRWRAVAGLCAAHARNQADPPADLLAELLRAGPDAAARGEVDVELAASLLAAVEALLEYVEGGADVDVAAARERLDRHGNDTADGLAALLRHMYRAPDPAAALEDPRAAAVTVSARALAGRLARLSGPPRDTLRHFQVALALMQGEPPLPTSGSAVHVTGDVPGSSARASADQTLDASDGLRFADWVPPDDIGARVRLEALRALPDESVEVLLDYLYPAPVSAATVDAARFFAARLRAVLSIRVPRDDEVVQPDATAYARPRCNAHRWAPPARVSFGEALAARGDVDAALRALRSFISLGGQIDLHDLQHAERALLRLAFRHRIGGGDAVSVSLAESRRPEDRELVWALLESSETDRHEPAWPHLPVDARRPIDPDRVRWLRAAWRTRNTLGAGVHDGYRELLELDTSDDPTAAALRLEIHEVVHDADTDVPALRELVDLTLDALWAGAEGDGRVRAAASRIRDMPRADAWAAELNLLAQSTRSVTGPFEQRLGQVAAVLGARRAAEIALYEADLLTMRLPDRADRLYDAATRLYAIARDTTGERLAASRIGQPTIEAAITDTTAAFARMPSAGELAGAGAAEAAGPPAAAPPAAAPSAPRRASLARGLERALPVIGAIVAVAMFATIFIVAFDLLRDATPQDSIFHGSTSESIIAYLIVLVVLFYGVPAFVRWAPSALASRARLHFSARAESHSKMLAASDPASAAAELVVAQWRLRLPWPRKVIETFALDIAFDTGVAYRELAAGLPYHAATVLTSLMSRLRRRSARLVLEVDRAVTAQPFEAILTRAGRRDLMAFATPPLRARRRLSGRRAAGRAPELPRRPKVLVSVTSMFGEVMVRRGWRRAADGLTSIPTTDFDDAMDAAARADVRVLHLVGDVVETNAGLRFRQSSGDPEPAASAVKSRIRPRARAGIDSAVDSDGLVLSAADVDRFFDRAVLCILQAEPLRRFSERGASDRVRAGLARAFAAELHLLGMPIVLVVPQLTPELGAQLLGRIDRFLTRPTRGAARLERCVADLQRRILRAADPKLPASWERAFDLCLYMEAGEDVDADAATGIAR